MLLGIDLFVFRLGFVGCWGCLVEFSFVFVAGISYLNWFG